MTYKIHQSYKTYFFLFVFFLLFFILPIKHTRAAAVLSKPSVNLTGLAGYWTMDGQDYNSASSTAEILDKSGSGYNGDAQNGPLGTEGKIGQGLKFDGSNDYVSMSSVPDPALADRTFSVWVKTNVLDSGTHGIMGWSAAEDVDRFVIYQRTTNQFVALVDTGSITNGMLYDITDAVANQWFHLAVSMDRDGNLVTYSNGVQTGSTSISASSGESLDPPYDFAVGTYRASGGGAANYFNGTIDDIRVYNRALSAAEIARLYQSGTAKFNSSQNNKLTSGMVGLWSMDGADYNAASTTAEVLDRSGNNNTGDATNGPVPTEGKVGQALKFDGSNDYVITSDIAAMDSQSAFTVSAWVKLDSTAVNQTVAGKFGAGGGVFLQTGQTTGCATGGDDIVFGFTSSNFVCTSGNLLKAGEWGHWVGTFDNALGTGKHKIYFNAVSQTLTNNGTPDSVTNTGASAASFEINRNGSGLNRFLGGVIDDVRVYNRALSAAEITQLYNMGATPAKVNSSQINRITSGLVGLWSFNGPDYNAASTTAEVLDRSGNNNTGDATNGPVPTEGKVGQALKFDGADDYVNLSSPTTLDDIEAQGGGGMTVSVWVNANTVTGDIKSIVRKGIGANGNGNWQLHASNASTPARIRFIKEGSTDLNVAWNSVLSTGVWTHLVLTWDGSMATSGANLYKNGVLETRDITTEGATANSDASNNLTIGGSTSAGEYFDGSLDDIRVYNRALSAAEIKQLYLMGK